MTGGYWSQQACPVSLYLWPVHFFVTQVWQWAKSVSFSLPCGAFHVEWAAHGNCTQYGTVIFTTWWDSPAKRCQIIFSKTFVKKVFQLVKPFLANLHSTSSNIYSYMYSMTPKNFCSFLAYEYSKFAEFYADFKSLEIIEKKSTQKKLFAKHFCKLVV